MHYTSRATNTHAHNLANWATRVNYIVYINPPKLPPSIFCNHGVTDSTSVIARMSFLMLMLMMNEFAYNPKKKKRKESRY